MLHQMMDEMQQCYEGEVTALKAENAARAVKEKALVKEGDKTDQAERTKQDFSPAGTV
ncbi:hypothetical protein LR48_Vigan635s001200 [Vigna angularis]|uniref:Uncharacterized protein n=1 Tax=Phaseolus angularis TaxID=3914 RepID=A0A0L9TF92_PHAAN|nr:hypothetical protein LR48_Vigan635s001200 [Vigna angularis]